MAVFAAAGEAQMTGKLPVCAGSCGPGNLHLINGLFDARRSRAPVLALAAEIPSAEIGGGYFQETHPQSLFRECSHIANWSPTRARYPTSTANVGTPTVWAARYLTSGVVAIALMQDDQADQPRQLSASVCSWIISIEACGLNGTPARAPAVLDDKVYFYGIQVTTAMISASVGKRPTVCFEQAIRSSTMISKAPPPERRRVTCASGRILRMRFAASRARGL